MSRFKVTVRERETEDIMRLAALNCVDVSSHSPRKPKRTPRAASGEQRSRAERPLVPLDE